MPIKLVWEAREVRAHTRNLSIGGMFVECEHPFAYGDRLVVEIQFPVSPEPSRIPATVRWNTREGVGISLGALSVFDVWAIHRLAELVTRAPFNTTG